jgi:HSP20 family molecular chaperone IbpA
MPGVDVDHNCDPVKLELKGVLERLRKYGESSTPTDNIVLAMNQTRAAVFNRIFNSEEGTKDVNGAGLGAYSNSYASYRRSRGRQANVIDLELTGSLRRDIKVVQTDDKVTLAIVSNSERLKSSYLETRFRRDIFSVSAEERDEFNRVLGKLFADDIKTILEGES